MILSIIIPVFNEENTLAEIIRRVVAVKLPRNIKKEIIIVNDGSSDNSGPIIKESATKNRNIKVYRHTKNKGKGAAVRTGLIHATGEVVVIQDADLEYDPEDFGRLIKPIIKGKSSVVYGTRLKNFPLKLFGKNNTPFVTHYLGNKLLSLVTRVLYGSDLTDMETCYKMFKKNVLTGIKLKSRTFELEPELTAKILKKGYKIHEVPIKVKLRGYNEGKKITWRDGFLALKTLVKYRFVD